MVQIKFSVIFILAAAVIAPALPLPGGDDERLDLLHELFPPKSEHPSHPSPQQHPPSPPPHSQPQGPQHTHPPSPPPPPSSPPPPPQPPSHPGWRLIQSHFIPQHQDHDAIHANPTSQPPPKRGVKRQPSMLTTSAGQSQQDASANPPPPGPMGGPGPPKKRTKTIYPCNGQSTIGCTRTFKSKDARAVHERTHTEAIFGCTHPGCPLAFHAEVDALNHISTADHTKNYKDQAGGNAASGSGSRA